MVGCEAGATRGSGLNAPSGAGCFLTERCADRILHQALGLNAPSGAGCFLTHPCPPSGNVLPRVLMHLLVLGAFLLRTRMSLSSSLASLNAPSGAGCFLTVVALNVHGEIVAS